MLSHLACRLFGTPLLIAPAKLDIIVSVLAPKFGLHAAPPAAQLAMPAPSLQPAVVGTGVGTNAGSGTGVAVIPVYGTLVKRTLGLDALSGLTSYAALAQQLDAALADPNVGAVLLDIDSGGGEASGVFELGRQIRAASAIKPVWAIANDNAFSAAYALGASAQRFYLTETGGAGSIGVIALHVDQSAKDAAEGLRYTSVTAGARKDDFSPHAALSPQAHASLQAEVDRLHGVFTGHVAAMRGIDAQVVRDTEAALFFGGQAVDAGLADGVQTLDATLAELHAFITSSSTAAIASRTAVHLPFAPMTQATQTTTAPASATLDADQIAAIQAEARQDAARALQANAQAIAEMCLLAGCPQRAAEFIAAGKTEAQARSALIEARAAASDATAVQSTITADAGIDSRSATAASSSIVVQAVKQLIARAA